MYGDTELRLTLPADVCFSFVRLEGGEMFTHPLKIDTLIIEPETQGLTLVWRAILVNDPETPIRALEARMHSRAEHAKLEVEITRIEKNLASPVAGVNRAK